MLWSLYTFLNLSVLKTVITVSYTPPDQYPTYSPPHYRAASSVTLSCSAQGASGSVSYRWSSTCSSCFASSSTSSTISENMLRSRDAGVHTCTVTDSSGNSGTNTTQMHIFGKLSLAEMFAHIIISLAQHVGAGIYVSSSRYGYAGRQASQPDNTYINVDSGTGSSYSSSRFNLYCCSNSTASSVGSFTDPYGNTYTGNFNDLRISRYSSGETNTGCIRMEGYEYYRNHISYTSGVYTCNIRDSTGQTQYVNFALYSGKAVRSLGST